jgi:hypothetical protein
MKHIVTLLSLLAFSFGQFAFADNVNPLDDYFYIYPKPKQLISFYGMTEQAVNDSLLAHGFTHIKTYGKERDASYTRLLYTRDCALGMEYDAPAIGSMEGILVEFTSINGQVIDPAIEFVLNDYGKRYLKTLKAMGYNTVWHNAEYTNLPRYYWQGHMSAKGMAYYKYVTQKRSGKKIAKEPILNKLYIDTYDLIGTKFFGGERLNIGVRKAIRYHNILRITDDDDADTHKGESVVWDITDDGPYKLKFSKEMVERKMQSIEEIIAPEKIVAKSFNDSMHHVFVKDDYKEEENGRLKTFKCIFAIDVTNISAQPIFFLESDRDMLITKGPDGKHIIVRGHRSIEDGYYFFVSFNIETGRCDTDTQYYSEREFSTASDGYVIDNENFTRCYDENGLFVKEISKVVPEGLG